MISEELMKQVRRLEIVTGRAVNELFAGEYQSAFRGLGMEFAEVREYQPGDDVRAIDWNVTARAGRPFIKRFEEERELTVMLVVDLSGSGRFGSHTRMKNEAAAELCAVLAFAATRNNDKVGLLIFTDRIELFIPPKKGSRHVLRVIREVLAFEPKGKLTNIGGALDYLANVLRRKAVVFLVSDFMDEGFEQPVRLVARRHDLVAVHISDPRESALPERGVGLIELEDAETGRRRVIDTSGAGRRRVFEAAAERQRGRLRENLARMGVDMIAVSTDRPYLQTLINFFRMREHRR